jgi:hypothetical protein
VLHAHVPWAVIVVLLGLGACDVPLGAIRRSPPPGIDARAVGAGTRAPPFALEGTQGTFRLGDAVASGNVLLVFYRGHW